MQPQPLRLLRVLVQHAGTVVSRETLRRTLWDASTFVEFDQGLNYCVRQLRIALHDDATRPVYIETIKRQGYRFLAPVEAIAPPAPIVSASSAPVVPANSSVPPVVRALDRRMLWPRGVSWLAAAIVIAAVALLAVAAARRTETQSPAAAAAPLTYRQLTNFSDAAFAPALSPDGRMLAFIVGDDSSFPPSGEVYVKLLPDGTPLQLTYDGWPKYGPQFSPDGTALAYTVTDASHGWSTRTVSPLGGPSQLLVNNASGLVWLRPDRLMFSEILSGLHMGLVTTALDRSSLRSVYLPAHERGMAHFGRPSPDGRTALVVEMGSNGGWQRCRLVPIDGHDEGRAVGPDGACTAAAWSPEGTMYFSAWVDGHSHLWRQSTADSAPEQITRGPADEQGLALSADGRRGVTSVGMVDSGLWIRDSTGDRLLVQEGTVGRPAFSRDGQLLYYIVRRPDSRTPELRALDMRSRVSRTVVSGLAISSYDLSADGSRLVMAVRSADRSAQLWTAATDGESPPRMLGVSGDEPCFGVGSTIYFRASANGHNYLFATTLEGAAPVKARETPVLELKGASPDKQWVLVTVPVAAVPTSAVIAQSTGSRREERICPGECMAAWSPDGSRFYVEPLLQGDTAGTVVEAPVTAEDGLPPLPAAGIASAADAQSVPGARTLDIGRVDPTRVGGNVAPGPTAGSFAYARVVARRNLFELQLR